MLNELKYSKYCQTGFKKKKKKKPTTSSLQEIYLSISTQKSRQQTARKRQYAMQTPNERTLV